MCLFMWTEKEAVCAATHLDTWTVLFILDKILLTCDTTYVTQYLQAMRYFTVLLPAVVFLNLNSPQLVPGAQFSLSSPHGSIS